jgi:hypothetical protein
MYRYLLKKKLSEKCDKGWVHYLVKIMVLLVVTSCNLCVDIIVLKTQGQGVEKWTHLLDPSKSLFFHNLLQYMV